MLPSTALTVEHVLRILRSRVWLLLVTFALVSAATAAAALLLPNRYRSETLILVVPQRVPESYVKSTVTSRIEDRLQSISQQILSRTRLEGIIEDFHLYAAKRRTSGMETVIEDMRKDITIKVVKGEAFRVAYVGDDARTVMWVTNRLASLFIEENLRDREELADGTNEFLETQLTNARHRLIEHEKKLEDYRKRFSGELPSQLTSNLQVIQNVQMQLQALVESSNRDRDRRLLIERQVRELEHETERDSSTLPVPPVAGETAGALAPASQRLAAARATLAEMATRLTPAHPDLQRMQRVVRDLEAKADAEGGTSIPASPAEIARRTRLADLRLELDQLDRQLAFKESEEKRLRGISAAHEQRVERVPARESDLAELMRDYSTLQTVYQSLLAKQEDSKIAANLEHRQIGDQFKLLDPARLPENPFSPKRWLITLLGMVAGLTLGLALVAWLEYRDRTFTTDVEIVKELTLPVLAMVPWMESDEECRRASRRRLVAACARGAFVAACVPVIVYSFLI
jgi:polysaccharide chain length determinant protein (PEP-CTERM system associated)